MDKDYRMDKEVVLNIPLWKDNPLLKQPCRRYIFGKEEYNPLDLVCDMIEVAQAKGGIAVAANQCGLPYRVLVILSDDPIAMFNPSIIETTDKKIIMDEGCLSFPGLSVRVTRAETIRVRYADPAGKYHTENYTGMSARVIQHEIDHLDGITFLDRCSIIQREKAKKKGFK